MTATLRKKTLVTLSDYPSDIYKTDEEIEEATITWELASAELAVEKVFGYLQPRVLSGAVDVDNLTESLVQDIMYEFASYSCKLDSKTTNYLSRNDELLLDIDDVFSLCDNDHVLKKMVCESYFTWANKQSNWSASLSLTEF